MTSCDDVMVYFPGAARSATATFRMSAPCAGVSPSTVSPLSLSLRKNGADIADTRAGRPGVVTVARAHDIATESSARFPVPESPVDRARVQRASSATQLFPADADLLVSRGGGGTQGSRTDVDEVLECVRAALWRPGTAADTALQRSRCAMNQTSSMDSTSASVLPMREPLPARLPASTRRLALSPLPSLLQSGGSQFQHTIDSHLRAKSREFHSRLASTHASALDAPNTRTPTALPRPATRSRPPSPATAPTTPFAVSHGPSRLRLPEFMYTPRSTRSRSSDISDAVDEVEAKANHKRVEYLEAEVQQWRQRFREEASKRAELTDARKTIRTLQKELAAARAELHRAERRALTSVQLERAAATALRVHTGHVSSSGGISR